MTLFLDIQTPLPFTGSDQLPAWPQEKIIYISHTANGADDQNQLVKLRDCLLFETIDKRLPRIEQLRYKIKESPICIFFHIKGGMRFKPDCCAQNDLEYITTTGTSTICWAPHSQGTVQFDSSSGCTHFSIFAAPSCFLEIMGEEPPAPWRRLVDLLKNKDGKGPFFHCSAMLPAMEWIIGQLVNTPYKGTLAKLYQEAKLWELIAMRLNFGNFSASSAKLRQPEQEQVRHAHFILLNNLSDPPDLIKLGRMVGLNRNKLNRGFRQLFGDTVFGLLRKERLAQAYRLLVKSDKPLAEIAQSVGFASQSSFSQAFFSHFGHPPGAVRRVLHQLPCPDSSHKTVRYAKK